jgi:hypothetical protein
MCFLTLQHDTFTYKLETGCSIDSATAGALGCYNLPDPYERIVEAEEPLNLGNHEIMTIKTFF